MEELQVTAIGHESTRLGGLLFVLCGMEKQEALSKGGKYPDLIFRAMTLVSNVQWVEEGQYWE